MDEAYVEAVLRVVESIPAGRVMSYGQVADEVGRYGPRLVGRVLSTYGGAVPWWRVVRVDGSLPPSHLRSAVDHYADEGTPVVEASRGMRVDVRAARWPG